MLRKINPMCFEIGSGELFLICGGYCLFDKTDTSCFIEVDNLKAQIHRIFLPKPFSSFNPNTLCYKGDYYYYGEEDNEIYEFSSFSKSFTKILTEDLVFN